MVGSLVVLGTNHQEPHSQASTTVTPGNEATSDAVGALCGIRYGFLFALLLIW